jgi:hypothetical protein
VEEKIMPSCTITDEEFIWIINSIAKQEAGALENILKIESLDQPLSDSQLDSLSTLMFYVWLTEMFGVPDNEVTMKAVDPQSTGRQIFDFVKQYQTQCYTFEDVKKVLKA